MLSRYIVVSALILLTSTSSIPKIQHLRNWNAQQLSDLTDYIKFDLMWKYYSTGDGINWQLNFNEFLTSPLADEITQTVGISRNNIKYNNCTGRILRRGDNVTPHQICSDPSEIGTVVLLVLTTPPDKNDYGELILFNEEGDDVIMAIRSGPGSLISFPCDQTYQWQYPAISTQRGLIFLQMLFIEEGDNVIGPDLDNAYLPLDLEIFGAYEDSGSQPSPVVTSSFELSPDKKVWVVDGLFEREKLRALRDHLLEHSSYIYNVSSSLSTS